MGDVFQAFGFKCGPNCFILHRIDALLLEI